MQQQCAVLCAVLTHPRTAQYIVGMKTEGRKPERTRVEQSDPNHLVRWLVFSIGGLILIGLGVSIVGEAIILKASQQPWFFIGTAGLVVLNSGVSCVGQGVIHRVRLGR